MERIDKQFELHDGRKLGYFEFGDPFGFPVINNHGGLVGRLDVTVDCPD